jgi:predicted dehydrogenase
MTNKLNTFVQVDPGHFHSALVLKESLEGVASTIHVYSELDQLLLNHLSLVSGFNQRADNPSNWKLEVHTGPDSLDRLIKEKMGEAVIIAGHNRSKIKTILACLENGFHVLADKPWVIEAVDFPLLEKALKVAQEKNLVVMDIMTERWEVVSMLQRELSNSLEIMGPFLKTGRPALSLRSSHSLCKKVNGLQLRRPVSFFDIAEQGEGLTDVGIHLVDLSMWLLFPDKGIHKNDIRIKSATRWPTILDLSQFQAATGQEKYPASLDDYVEGDCLTYFGNNTVDFEIHGLNIHVDTRWDFMAGPDGLDTYSAITRGEKARIELRQNEATNFESEIFVKPVSHSMDQLQMLLEAKIKDISQKYEGLGLIRHDEEFQLSIPKKLRTGHESHFGMITRQFLSHLRKESPIPSWEFANHLSRYFITVEGVKMSRGTV